MRLLLVTMLLTLTVASPVTADTGEQNRIEGACMALVLTDAALYGVLRFGAHFDAYMLCGVTWWVSWLPETAQALWWRWQYAYALQVLAEVR